MREIGCNHISFFQLLVCENLADEFNLCLIISKFGGTSDQEGKIRVDCLFSYDGSHAERCCLLFFSKSNVGTYKE